MSCLTRAPLRAGLCALAAAFFTALTTAPLAADCTGSNLIAALPAEEAAALRAETGRQPFATGLFWRATRGAEVIHLIGTFHLDDPRHVATMERLSPVLDGATALLVEAGPEEEAALKTRLARDPSLMINSEGPTLREALPEAEWQALAAAMEARGVPAFMASKLRPWYLTMLLGVPACNLAALADGSNGLDRQLVEEAEARAIPVQALEPYDTIFGIFGDLPQKEQLEMITSALAMEPRSADMAVTLADSYFAEEGRLIWEFLRVETLKMPGYTPERVDEEFALTEEVLMNKRNRAWIPVIEAAAAKGPVLVAFGALHLSGKEGVLALLEAQGFRVERLPLQ